MPETSRVIYNNKSQLLHQVGISLQWIMHFISYGTRDSTVWGEIKKGNALRQCFPNLLARGSLLASANIKSSHFCISKYKLSAWLVSNYIYIYIYTHIYVCKGVTDRLLKHIQRVHPAAFCSRDFFLLHDNVPTHKPASVCQFLTQKNVTTHTLQIYLHQTIFCSPSWKWS